MGNINGVVQAEPVARPVSAEAILQELFDLRISHVIIVPDTHQRTLLAALSRQSQIKVLTAEGRLSAWVLALLPIAIGLYMAAVNPSYIGLLVTTTIGLVMLGTAIVLMFLGILWMRKIVNIDV